MRGESTTFLSKNIPKHGALPVMPETNTELSYFEWNVLFFIAFSNSSGFFTVMSFVFAYTNNVWPSRNLNIFENFDVCKVRFNGTYLAQIES